MSLTGLSVFDSTVEKTNIWLNEIQQRLGCNDRHRAYQALRAVLHALRDRLMVLEAVDLAAQLPLLIRGIYYEGWRPTETPVTERKKEGFLTHVAQACPGIDPEEVTRVVFQVLAKHVTPGEVADVKQMLPHEVRELWSLHATGAW